MKYYFRQMNMSFGERISRADAGNRMSDFYKKHKLKPDFTMLDIPNRIDVDDGEVICVTDDNEKPLNGYRNMTPDAYYAIVGEDKRKPTVNNTWASFIDCIKIVKFEIELYRDYNNIGNRRHKRKNEMKWWEL